MLYPRAYLWFSAVLALTLLGFFDSYFDRLSQASPVHHFHAVTATLWMLLLISQSWAISHGKVQWHRAAGKLSYGLAPLFIGSGFLIIQAMQLGPGPFRRVFGPGLGFVDIVAVGLFAWLYFAAIRNRRNMQLHARYMSATVLPLLSPILARVFGNYVPGMDSFRINMHLGTGVALAAALVLLYRDRKTIGIKPPYLVAAIAFVVQSVGFELLRDVAWWRAFMQATSGIPAWAMSLTGLAFGVVLVLAAVRRGRPVVTKATAR